MDGHGKRVSWVELYLDLIFVLAVGQLSHFLVEEPEMRSVWVALGLFMTMWWTWIGFAVLYNRRGEDVPQQRILFLAGSIPAGVAAVALGPAVARRHDAAGDQPRARAAGALRARTPSTRTS